MPNPKSTEKKPSIVEQLNQQAESVSVPSEPQKPEEIPVFNGATYETLEHAKQVLRAVEAGIADVEQREIKLKKRERDIQLEAERLLKMKEETRELVNRYEHARKKGQSI